MSETELPANLPRYCDMCGGRITVTVLERHERRGQAVLECSACGHKSGIGWSEGGGEVDEKSPAGEWIYAGESWGPALKIDEEGNVTYEALTPKPTLPPDPPELVEQREEYRQISQRADKYGINALLEAAQFPIFAFVDLEPRLLPRGTSRGRRWTRGAPRRPALGKAGFLYVGPSYEEPTEGLTVENTDSETLPEAFTAGGFLDAQDASILLMNVAFGLLDLPELHEGRAIYRYVNQEAFGRADVLRPRVRLRSGEEAEWEVRRLTGPVAFGYAGTRIGRASIRIGAVGPVADDLESLLGQLTRLVIGSEEVSALDEAHRRAR
ncbi:MAG: hypothetical protein IIA89_06650 [Chloroflexi bacterium]|nr:hypothetical protein [Chloroflexota bacterium]